MNNESAEMLRWLPTAFESMLPERTQRLDLYPADLAPQIDDLSTWMQSDLNTGVYKAGFAPSQEAYDAAVPVVFRGLNKLEALIAKNGGPFILGKKLTELDLRAYVTVVRFDTIYVQHFKCNLGTIRHDYPVINNWLKNLYWNVPGFKDTTDFKHIKENCKKTPCARPEGDLRAHKCVDSKSHYDINPKAITPMGPIPNVESGVEEDISKLRIGSVDI